MSKRIMVLAALFGLIYSTTTGFTGAPGAYAQVSLESGVSEGLRVGKWDFWAPRVARGGKAVEHCRQAPIPGEMVDGQPRLRAVLYLKDSQAVLTGCTMITHGDVEFDITEPSGMLVEFGCRIEGAFFKSQERGEASAAGEFRLESDWMRRPWTCKKDMFASRNSNPEDWGNPFGKSDTRVGCIPAGKYKIFSTLKARARFLSSKDIPGEVNVDLHSNDRYGFTLILVFHGACRSDQYQKDATATQ